MRDWPQHYREDTGVTERICPHGVGHPDPDQAWPADDWRWVHGCDGCCARTNDPNCAADGAVKLKNTMTKEQAIEELKKAQANGDTECAHGHADDILCKLLAALGYADVVSEYEKVDKWYA